MTLEVDSPPVITSALSIVLSEQQGRLAPVDEQRPTYTLGLRMSSYITRVMRRRYGADLGGSRGGLLTWHIPA